MNPSSENDSLQNELKYFRLIFADLSLNELIQNRIVSKKWKAAIEYILAEKTTLKLFKAEHEIFDFYEMLGVHGLSHYPELKLSPTDDDHLFMVPSQLRHFPNLDYSKCNNYHLIVSSTVNIEYCTFLVNLFPNVNSLFIFNDLTPSSLLDNSKQHFESTAFLKYLFENWPQLRFLGLKDIEINWSEILPSIVQLENLKHLIFIDVYGIGMLPLDMPILHQLEELTIRKIGKREEVTSPSGYKYRQGSVMLDFFPLVNLMSLNGKRLNIKFPKAVNISEVINFFESKRNELNQVDHLTLEMKDLQEISQTLWPLIGQVFSSLTYLDISLARDVSVQ